jgi:hypothetical protein
MPLWVTSTSMFLADDAATHILLTSISGVANSPSQSSFDLLYFQTQRPVVSDCLVHANVLDHVAQSVLVQFTPASTPPNAAYITAGVRP